MWEQVRNLVFSPRHYSRGTLVCVFISENVCFNVAFCKSDLAWLECHYQCIP